MEDQGMTADLEEALRTPDVMPSWVSKTISAAEWAATPDALRIAIIKFQCPTKQPGEDAEEALLINRWREESKMRNRAMGRVHISLYGPTGGQIPYWNDDD